MGSGAEAVEEAIDSGTRLQGGCDQGSALPSILTKYFLEVLPKTVKVITVLDRTKELRGRRANV